MHSCTENFTRDIAVNLNVSQIYCIMLIRNYLEEWQPAVIVFINYYPHPKFYQRSCVPHIVFLLCLTVIIFCTSILFFSVISLMRRIMQKLLKEIKIKELLTNSILWLKKAIKSDWYTGNFWNGMADWNNCVTFLILHEYDNLRNGTAKCTVIGRNGTITLSLCLTLL